MSTINKGRKGNRRVEGGRLVYYNKKATQGYWEDVWLKDLSLDFYKPFQVGNLFNFEKIFIRHLPKTGRILEAGCGTAQLVVALNAKGYHCLGTDFAISTLKKAQELIGPLELFASDLTTVGVVDGSFDAIISIGVVEHRQEGPEPFLNEKQRIMQPGGMLLISVPYFNPLRQWRAAKGAYQGNVDEYEFYQYAYPREEFLDFVRKAGFEIEAVYTYAHQNTLVEELEWLNQISGFLKKMILQVSKYVPYVNSELGHMLMVVARKKVL